MAQITLTIPNGDAPDVQRTAEEKAGLAPATASAANLTAALIAWIKIETRGRRRRVAEAAVNAQSEPDIT